MEVRCRRCNKVLTNPVSKKRGFGPVCWARLQRNHALEDYPDSGGDVEKRIEEALETGVLRLKEAEGQT